MTAMALAPQAELADQRAVALEILLLEVVQEPPAPAHEHQEAAARVMVVLVRPQVLREVVDAARQQGDLDIGGAGVLLVLAEALDDLELVLLCQGHMRRGRLAERFSAPRTVFRPARLATKSALSARLTSASASSSPSHVAQPMLTVTARSRPSMRVRALSTLARRLSATT